MCEDEEIILKCSPLDKYLKDVMDAPFSSYEKDSNITIKPSENDCFPTLRDLIHKSEILPPPFIVDSCLTILNSGLLLEDDEKLILEFKEKLTSINNFHHPQHKQIIGDDALHKLSYFVCILSILIPLFLQRALLFIFLIPFFGILVLSFRRLSYKNKVKQFTDAVSEFCKVLNEFNLLLDKCIVHIKEVEVIYHGIPHLKSTELIGLTLNGTKCSQLRKLLVRALSSNFYKCRNLQKIILKGNNISNKFDVKEEFIASISLDFYSEILNLEGNHVADLKEIKQLVCLYRLQLSELVYKMANEIYSLEFNNCFGIIELAKNIMLSVKQCTQEIQYHLGLSIKNIFEKEETILSKTVQKEKSTDGLFHSSEVNLLSALHCIEKMKNLFQGTSFSETDDRLEQLSGIFLQFNLALENAKSLIENVENSFKPKQVTSSVVSSEKWCQNQGTNNIVLFQKFEEQGDILYEGQSEKVIPKRSDLENAEDLESLIKVKKASKNLMRELKCILAVKEKPEGLISFPLSKPLEMEKEFEEEHNNKSDDLCPKHRPAYSFDYNDYIKPEFQFLLPVTNFNAEDIYEDFEDEKNDSTP